VHLELPPKMGISRVSSQPYYLRCLPGDGKWMVLEFAVGLFGTGLDSLETVISVNYA